jgi:hypothetical protein
MIDIKQILVNAVERYDTLPDEANRVLAIKLIMSQLKNALISNFPDKIDDIKGITIPIDDFVREKDSESNMNQDRVDLYATYQFVVSAGDTVFGVANSEQERINFMQEAQRVLPGEVVNVQVVKKSL